MEQNYYKKNPFLQYYSIEDLYDFLKTLERLDNQDKKEEKPKECSPKSNNINDFIDKYLSNKYLNNKINKNMEKEDTSKVDDKEIKKEADNFYMENMEGRVGVILTYIIPGLAKEDVKITLHDNFVKVFSEKEVAYFGKLDSKVKMKFDIDVKASKAHFENGILKIYLYKKKVDEFSITIE